jgi:hypothetical protein
MNCPQLKRVDLGHLVFHGLVQRVLQLVQMKPQLGELNLRKGPRQ